MEKIGLDEKFALFSETWRPKVAARLNGQEVKLVKVRGSFPAIATRRPTRCSWCGGAVFGSGFATATLRCQAPS